MDSPFERADSRPVRTSAASLATKPYSVSLLVNVTPTALFSPKFTAAIADEPVIFMNNIIKGQ